MKTKQKILPIGEDDLAQFLLAGYPGSGRSFLEEARRYFDYTSAYPKSTLFRGNLAMAAKYSRHNAIQSPGRDVKSGLTLDSAPWQILITAWRILEANDGFNSVLTSEEVEGWRVKMIAGLAQPQPIHLIRWIRNMVEFANLRLVDISSEYRTI